MSGFFNKIAGFIGATNGQSDVPEAIDVPSSNDNNSDSSFDMVSLNSSSKKSDFESVKEEEQVYSDSSDSFVDCGSKSGGNGECGVSDIDDNEYSFGNTDDSENESEYSHISTDVSDPEEPSAIEPEFAMEDLEDIFFGQSPFSRIESSASYHSLLNQQYGHIEYATDSEESFDDGADIREESESESDVSTEEIERVVVKVLEEKMGNAMASVFSKIQLATEKLNTITTENFEKKEEINDDSFCEAYSAALMNPMEVEEEVEKIQNPEASREYTGQELITMFEKEMTPETQFFVEQLLEELHKACSGEEDPKERHMKIRQVINQNMRDYVKDLQQRINKLAGRKVY